MTVARCCVPFIRLEEGGAVTLHFSAADDSGEAAAHALTMTAVLTLRFRDLTGGDHVITLLLNGTHVHRTLLQDEFRCDTRWRRTWIRRC